jgi:hypothetical protein
LPFRYHIGTKKRERPKFPRDLPDGPGAAVRGVRDRPGPPRSLARECALQLFRPNFPAPETRPPARSPAPEKILDRALVRCGSPARPARPLTWASFSNRAYFQAAPSMMRIARLRCAAIAPFAARPVRRRVPRATCRSEVRRGNAVHRWRFDVVRGTPRRAPGRARILTSKLLTEIP